jgi:wyosine [tRNA(Phe)-imidazoG37] synthetase (radical SAM superfamily)
MEQIQVKVYKVPEYTRRAINRYQEKNKEKIREYAKEHSKNRYHNDPEYREYKKQKTRERYLINKEKTIQNGKEKQINL